ncbi:MAG: thiamine phosphate synthase [Arenimonas sp.]
MTLQTIWPHRGLYLLTPDESDTGRLVARVEPLLALGVSLLQLRCKSGGIARRREQTRSLLPLCRAHGVPLIINDDWQTACELGAAGAHLGADDGSLVEARAALGPDAILGASCYGDLQRARGAMDAGASYLAFGAFFPSTSKPLATRAPLSVLREAQALGLPLVAIGGITPDNAATLVDAGADLLAVIGAVFDAPDPAARVRAFRNCFSSMPRPDPSPA